LIAKGEGVDTISASTVLITYNWAKNTDRYERTAKFVDAFFSKIDEFHKPPRSPLWKSVNLAAGIPGWTRFPAAEDWIADYRARQTTAEETNSKRLVDEKGPQPSAAQLDQLFHEFESWKRER
jgi:hypothetical protein